MRRIKLNNILMKMYSIQDNRVIKKENGDYFSEDIAKMILVNQSHNDFENIKRLEKQDNKKHEKAVKKYCETKTKEISLEKYPSLIEKNYEIFKLDLNTENIYLFNKKDLPLPESMEKQELFFKFEYAKKALEIYKNIEENILNNFQEAIELLNKETSKDRDELERLKEADEKEYLESIKIYSKIKNTDFMLQYNNLINENENLNEKIKEAKKLLVKVKERNKMLEEKLKNSSEKNESNKSNSIFKKIFKKNN